MAFKMKGFPFAGKSPIKDIQGDGTPEGTNHYHNNKHYDGMKHDKDGKWIEETKPKPKSPMKQNKVNDAAGAGAVAGGAAMSGTTIKGTSKHPLYEKLTAGEKKAYNALTPKQKANVDKNKDLSQLKNALGNYQPKWEGGDDDPN
tara:strand:+ start:4999 stop:5433 length:435 start_codon:yes stop_codon:yes gene_type:complete